MRSVCAVVLYGISVFIKRVKNITALTVSIREEPQRKGKREMRNNFDDPDIEEIISYIFDF